MQRVGLEDLGDLFEQPWLATLATHRQDGSVLLSPVWWEWDGEAFWVSIPDGDIQDRHIRRDPTVSLSLAEEASFPGRGLEIGATVERIPDPGPVGLRRIATRYLGSEVADEWLAQFGAIDWILLRLKPTRVRAWDHRDEPLLRRAAPIWPGGRPSLPAPAWPSNREVRKEVVSSTRRRAQTLALPGREWALLLGPENGQVRNVTLGYSTFPPGSAPSGHLHPGEEELIYVVAGRGQLRTSSAVVDLEPGVAVYIPPGVEHGTAAAGDERVELLTIFSPPVIPGSYEAPDNTHDDT